MAILENYSTHMFKVLISSKDRLGKKTRSPGLKTLRKTATFDLYTCHMRTSRAVQSPDHRTHTVHLDAFSLRGHTVPVSGVLNLTPDLKFHLLVLIDNGTEKYCWPLYSSVHSFCYWCSSFALQSSHFARETIKSIVSHNSNSLASMSEISLPSMQECLDNPNILNLANRAATESDQMI